MLRAWKQRLGMGMVAFFVAAPVWAQGDIVDTAYVEQALARGAIVWDAREAADYAAGHIPGAVNFGWVGKVFRDPNREDLPSVPEAAKLFGAAGVDPVGKEVIIYTRLILAYHGFIPRHYVDFLDYAAERIFLHKIGGGYIFFHPLLQDYFSALHQESQSRSQFTKHTASPRGTRGVPAPRG